MPETDSWPFVRARWFTKTAPGVRRNVRLIVIHAMQFPERTDAAEVIAHDFATRPESSKASAHLCIDNNSIIQCVWDNDVAYAAPGANSDGLQIELAGFTEQSGAQWLDDYSKAMLELAAKACAQYCGKYAIPSRHLTNAELQTGAKGFVGHDQVSEVYKKSDHTDPGAGFPWDYFMGRVAHHLPACV